MLFTIGCTNMNTDEKNETGSNNETTHPINYETKEQEQNRLGVNKQNTNENDYYKGDNPERINSGKDGNHNTDIFTTDEAKKISEQLSKRKDIKQTQVATTEKSVIVGIMLNEQSKQIDNQNIVNDIEKEVSKLSPNKEIVVYTDNIHWNQMKNLDSTIRNKDNGDNNID